MRFYMLVLQLNALLYLITGLMVMSPFPILGGMRVQCQQRREWKLSEKRVY